MPQFINGPTNFIQLKGTINNIEKNIYHTNDTIDVELIDIIEPLMNKFLRWTIPFSLKVYHNRLSNHHNEKISDLFRLYRITRHYRDFSDIPFQYQYIF